MWASHVLGRGSIAALLMAGVLLLTTHAAAYANDSPPAQTGCLTIGQIQGPGNSSALDGRKGLSCVTGCVIGVAADGFYLQSARPDAAPNTSEGIFVYRWSGWTNPRKLKPGDLLEIRDFGVQEFYGSTEIVKLKSDRETAYRRLGACKLPDPIPIDPPMDLITDPQTVLERYEGMRVALDVDGYVSGPTTRYISRFPAGDPEIALVPVNSSLSGRRIFSGEVAPGRGMIYLSGGLGRDLPAVGVGARLTASRLTGVLAFQFGRYILLIDEESPQLAVQATPEQSQPRVPIGPDEFGVCSFNVKNLFDAVDDGDGDVGDWSPANEAEYMLRLDKCARAIKEDLRGCSVVGLQEVEGKDAVWERLAAAAGGYRFDYVESADARDITVGILYDPRRVTVKQSGAAQGCGATDFGVDYQYARGDRADANPCAAGYYPVFDRPPYVADLTVRSASGDAALDLRVIVNHFKSRRGDETENIPQRLAQADYVAQLLAGPHRIALGDFNDTPDSATLQRLSAFTDLYETHVLRADAYTYIYNGLAESPDYVIVSTDLLRYIKAAGPVHINADFPDLRLPERTSRRSSDHDPLLVRFTFDPRAIWPDWRRNYEGRWRQNQSFRLK